MQLPLPVHDIVAMSFTTLNTYVDIAMYKAMTPVSMYVHGFTTQH